jgi:hypothetical protein
MIFFSDWRIKEPESPFLRKVFLVSKNIVYAIITSFFNTIFVYFSFLWTIFTTNIWVAIFILLLIGFSVFLLALPSLGVFFLVNILEGTRYILNTIITFRIRLDPFVGYIVQYYNLGWEIFTEFFRELFFVHLCPDGINLECTYLDRLIAYYEMYNLFLLEFWKGFFIFFEALTISFTEWLCSASILIAGAEQYYCLTDNSVFNTLFQDPTYFYITEDGWFDIIQRASSWVATAIQWIAQALYDYVFLILMWLLVMMLITVQGILAFVASFFHVIGTFIISIAFMMKGLRDKDEARKHWELGTFDNVTQYEETALGRMNTIFMLELDPISVLRENNETGFVPPGNTDLRLILIAIAEFYDEMWNWIKTQLPYLITAIDTYFCMFLNIDTCGYEMKLCDLLFREILLPVFSDPSNGINIFLAPITGILANVCDMVFDSGSECICSAIEVDPVEYPGLVPYLALKRTKTVTCLPFSEERLCLVGSDQYKIYDKYCFFRTGSSYTSFWFYILPAYLEPLANNPPQPNRCYKWGTITETLQKIKQFYPVYTYDFFVEKTDDYMREHTINYTTPVGSYYTLATGASSYLNHRNPRWDTFLDKSDIMEETANGRLLDRIRTTDIFCTNLGISFPESEWVQWLNNYQADTLDGNLRTFTGCQYFMMTLSICYPRYDPALFDSVLTTKADGLSIYSTGNLFCPDSSKVYRFLGESKAKTRTIYMCTIFQTWINELRSIFIKNQIAKQIDDSYGQYKRTRYPKAGSSRGVPPNDYFSFSGDVGQGWWRLDGQLVFDFIVNNKSREFCEYINFDIDNCTNAFNSINITALEESFIDVDPYNDFYFIEKDDVPGEYVGLCDDDVMWGYFFNHVDLKNKNSYFSNTVYWSYFFLYQMELWKKRMKIYFHYNMNLLCRNIADPYNIMLELGQNVTQCGVDINNCPEYRDYFKLLTADPRTVALDEIVIHYLQSLSKEVYPFDEIVWGCEPNGLNQNSDLFNDEHMLTKHYLVVHYLMFYFVAKDAFDALSNYMFIQNSDIYCIPLEQEGVILVNDTCEWSNIYNSSDINFVQNEFLYLHKRSFYESLYKHLPFMDPVFEYIGGWANEIFFYLRNRYPGFVPDGNLHRYSSKTLFKKMNDFMLVNTTQWLKIANETLQQNLLDNSWVNFLYSKCYTMETFVNELCSIYMNALRTSYNFQQCIIDPRNNSPKDCIDVHMQEKYPFGNGLKIINNKYKFPSSP